MTRVYLGIGSPGPDGADGATGATGPPGVGANWRGIWASGTTYAVGDGVAGSDGNLYISDTSGNVGNDPTSDGGVHWSPLASSLPTVPAGTGLTYNGSAYVGDMRPIDLTNESSDPDSVTDWGASINSLATAGARTIDLGRVSRSFPVTTELLLPDGMTFEGGGGACVNPSESPQGPILLWNGTGSGNFIKLGSGCTLRDIAVGYSSGSFTGDLLDGTNSITGLVCERVWFGSPGASLTSAHAVAALVNVFGAAFRDCFIGGAQSGLRGMEGSSGECTSVIVDGGWMYSCPNGCLVNIGQSWRIWTRFETGGSYADGPIVNNDIGSSIGESSFTLGGTIEDGGVANAIHQQSYEQWDCKISDLSSLVALDGPLMKFDGSGTIRVVDNPLLSVASGAVIDLGTTGKVLVKISGNKWQTAQSAGNPDILNVETQIAAGCDLRIGNNGETYLIGGTNNTPNTESIELVNTVNPSGAGTIAIPSPGQTGITMNRIKLTGDPTLTFPTASAGQSFMLTLVQDGTGGRTVTWPGSDLVWAAGSAPTLATAANKRDRFSFVCDDGTNWEGIQVSPAGGY